MARKFQNGDLVTFKYLHSRYRNMRVISYIPNMRGYYRVEYEYRTGVDRDGVDIWIHQTSAMYGRDLTHRQEGCSTCFIND